jgi:hypothetical protein
MLFLRVLKKDYSTEFVLRLRGVVNLHIRRALDGDIEVQKPESIQSLRPLRGYDGFGMQIVQLVRESVAKFTQAKDLYLAVSIHRRAHTQMPSRQRKKGSGIVGNLTCLPSNPTAGM